MQTYTPWEEKSLTALPLRSYQEVATGAAGDGREAIGDMACALSNEIGDDVGRPRLASDDIEALDADAVGGSRAYLQLTAVAAALEHCAGITAGEVIGDVAGAKQLLGLTIERNVVIKILLGNEVVVDIDRWKRISDDGTRESVGSVGRQVEIRVNLRRGGCGGQHGPRCVGRLAVGDVGIVYTVLARIDNHDVGRMEGLCGCVVVEQDGGLVDQVVGTDRLVARDRIADHIGGVLGRIHIEQVARLSTQILPGGQRQGVAVQGGLQPRRAGAKRIGDIDLAAIKGHLGSLPSFAPLRFVRQGVALGDKSVGQRRHLVGDGAQQYAHIAIAIEIALQVGDGEHATVSLFQPLIAVGESQVHLATLHAAVGGADTRGIEHGFLFRTGIVQGVGLGGGYRQDSAIAAQAAFHPATDGAGEHGDGVVEIHLVAIPNHLGHQSLAVLPNRRLALRIAGSRCPLQIWQEVALGLGGDGSCGDGGELASLLHADHLQPYRGGIGGTELLRTSYGRREGRQDEG